ncbi:hypothetical protein DAPPUDRAFT_249813 [Daphnia pulex]|uniref:Uncharacterized protein n=1 Tax=Daphnia pulex TaxID=6669 RepID=E9GXC1_DAPPU|nr:hypothetical protein DAPPUDRAFT_249813 [Daphnia pulex]|eukprot:EFX75886.1 hypothetical protein DAPPUDRAFT_249813 [Daphnia pulex]
MNLINPVRESETSNAIDDTSQMDFEETSGKRKINKENHTHDPDIPDTQTSSTSHAAVHRTSSTSSASQNPFYYYASLKNWPS